MSSVQATRDGATATADLPIAGMDCQDEATAIETAIRRLPGVREVRATVSGARATVVYDPTQVTATDLAAAIQTTGCSVQTDLVEGERESAPAARDVGQIVGWGALGMVAAVVLVAALGERIGIFDEALERLPWWIPALAIALGGWRVFRNVARAALRGQVISHTLMTAGVIAAAAVGQWTTAALIVFFMRFADWLEDLTTERSRSALRQLTALRPTTARVVRDGREMEIGVEELRTDEVMMVRPGERIPADGEVVNGEAPVHQSTITGESVPADKSAGDSVFAATVVQAGFLMVRATKVGADTTFARIVRLVEEAEARKAPVQRFADRFSTYYLPTVLVIGLATYLITGQVLNAVAVLVVACSCAITLATPVVVLASVGNAARRGLLIKGGLTLEQLARVDTVVLDKTGTVTFGRPRLTDVVALDGQSEIRLIAAVASVESRSEHPLARAIVRGAQERGIELSEPEDFRVLAGRGVAARLDGAEWAVGTRRLLRERGVALLDAHAERARTLEAQGRTAFFAARDGRVAGIIALADPVRPEVRAAVEELRALGVRRILMLTGDAEPVARTVAGELGIDHRAELLPEDKIAAVRELQAAGAKVLMVGDGINDGPALAQADVGVAMGAAGTDVALEAADVALMRDDWSMVPEAIRLGRRSARTIRENLGFAALYNAVGITLAFIGLLPPVWAAAAQSLPDMAVMLNSARLYRSSPRVRPAAR